MDALLAHYERKKIYYSQEDHQDPRMVRAIEMGWFVLDKYYNMTEEAPVYAAALLLDPSRKAAYIRKNWPALWVEPAIEAADALWEENFKEMPVPDDPPTLLPMPPPAKPLKKRGVELDLLMGSNIQRIECIGSWIREGHIRPSNLNGMGLAMEATAADEDDELDDEVLDEIEWI